MRELHSPKPIVVVDLFPGLLDELCALLAGLNPEEWTRPTACQGWSVKDVVCHLLGVEIANLSGRRDGNTSGKSIAGWDELVTFINQWNGDWVQVGSRISPRLLMDLLEVTGKQLNEYFYTLDLNRMGGSISWVGPQPQPVWLDIAREYSERWHHQQHIRDAVGKPGLKQPRYFAPILATFVWGLPRAFRPIQAEEGTAIALKITGPSGGVWSILREETEWKLYEGMAGQPKTIVTLDEDIAWRLFTRGMTPDQARKQAVIEGEQSLGERVFEVVSIIA